MKKVFFVLAVCAVVSAALVGCGSSSSTEGSDSAATSTAAVSSSAESSAEEVNTVAIGETATIGGWEITVTSVEYAPELTPISQSPSFKHTISASEGNQFVIVNAQIKNTSEDLDIFLPDSSFTEYTKETLIYDGKYNYNGRSTEGTMGTYNSLINEVVSPLETKTGYIAFDVPNEVAESEKPLQLKIEHKKNSDTLDSVTFNLR